MPLVPVLSTVMLGGLSMANKYRNNNTKKQEMSGGLEGLKVQGQTVGNVSRYYQENILNDPDLVDFIEEATNKEFPIRKYTAHDNPNQLSTILGVKKLQELDKGLAKAARNLADPADTKAQQEYSALGNIPLTDNVILHDIHRKKLVNDIKCFQKSAQKHESLTKEKDELAEKLTELQTEKEQIQSQLEDKRRELEGQNKKIGHLQDEEKVCEDYRRQNEKIMQEIKEQSELIQNQIEHNMENDRQKEKLEKEKEELQRQFDNIKTNLNKQEVLINGVRQELRQSETARQQCEQTKSELERQIVQIQQEQRNLTEQANQRVEEITNKYKQELDDAKRTYELTTQELEALKVTHTALTKEKGNLTKRITELEDSNRTDKENHERDLKQAKEELEGKIRRSSEEITNKNGDLEVMHGQIEALRKKLKENDQQRIQLAEALKRCEENNTGILSEKTAALLNVTNLEKELEATRLQISAQQDLEKQVRELKTDNTGKETLLTSTQEALKMCKQEKSALNSELKKKQALLEKLQSKQGTEASSLNTEVEQLKEKIKGIVEEKEIFERETGEEKAKLNAAIVKKTEALENCENNAKLLEAEIDKLKGEIAIAEANSKSSQEKADQLGTVIKSKEAEHAALAEKQAETEETAKKLGEEVSQLKQTIGDLKAAEAKAKEIFGMSSADTEAVVSRLRQTLQEAEANLEKKTQSLSDCEKKLVEQKELEEQIAQLRQELGAKSEVSQGYLGELNNRRKQLTELTGELKKNQTQLMSLRHTLLITNDEVKKLKEKAEAAEGEKQLINAELDRRLKACQANIDAKQNELLKYQQDAQAQAQTLGDEISKLKARIAEVEAEDSRCKQNLLEIKEKYEATIMQKEEELTKVGRDVAAQQAEIENLKKARETNEQLSSESSSKIAEIVANLQKEIQASNTADSENARKLTQMIQDFQEEMKKSKDISDKNMDKIIAKMEDCCKTPPPPVSTPPPPAADISELKTLILELQAAVKDSKKAGDNDEGTDYYYRQDKSLVQSLGTFDEIKMFDSNKSTTPNKPALVNSVDFSDILSHVMGKKKVQKYFAISAMDKAKVQVVTGNRYEYKKSSSADVGLQAEDQEEKRLGCSPELCSKLIGYETEQERWELYQLY
jgi:chromosome segregation ATPase